MKIARIETFILGTGSSKDLLFCRVETEDGLHGWGEAYVTQGKEKVVAECIQAMAPHVIGSAFSIRHTGQVMYGDFAIKRGSWKELSGWAARRRTWMPAPADTIASTTGPANAELYGRYWRLETHEK